MSNNKQRQQFEKQLSKAKDKYPEGSLVEVEFQDHNELPRFSEMDKLPETFKGRVTGHTICDQTYIGGDKDRLMYPEEELGLRVEVSNNPPERIGGEVEESHIDYSKACSVKPENIRKVEGGQNPQ